MFKKILKLTALALIVLAFCAPVAVQAAWDHYTISVYRDKGYTYGPAGHALITSGVQYMVLSPGTEATLATIYSDRGLTAMTNPVTATVFETLDRIDFWVDDSSYSTVDIIVVDNVGGFTLFLDGITPNVKNCIIDERPNIMHHGIIWWDASSTSTNVKAGTKDTTASAYDTGIDIPAGTLIDHVAVRTITDCYYSAAVQINVGLGAYGQGLLSNSLTDRQEYRMAVYWSDTSTIGTLMLNKGSDGAEYTSQPYYVLTAASLNYGFSSADDTEAGENTVAAGYIHFFFTPLMPL